MKLLGFETRDELIQFFNSPERPTGGMKPPDDHYAAMQELADAQEEDEEDVHPAKLAIEVAPEPDTFVGWIMAQCARKHTGELETHIVPGYFSQGQAIFYGHEISPFCTCRPEIKTGSPMVYSHRALPVH